MTRVRRSLEQKLRELRSLGIASGIRASANPRALYHDTRLKLRLLFHNAPYWLKGAPDGLPIPPLKLRRLIWDECADIRVFFQRSARVQYILDVLNHHGANIRSFEAILDFGCGAGCDIRQFRHLTLKAKVHGTDINPEQIDWCRANLPFADYAVNQPHPPLVYSDEKFDFIYTFSVFTHLSEPQQFMWVNELARVLRPGGYLLITTCGDSYLGLLTQHEREQFRAGRLVVRNAELAGIPSSYGTCIVYHPVEYVKEKLAKGFELIQFSPAEASGPVGEMDQYFLKKQ
jgi:2-polyprenyl-3-methyl-5-hydroxy-6-metoxy-1,4-benzoquinol methylase